MTTTVVVTAPDQPCNVEIRRYKTGDSPLYVAGELVAMLKAGQSTQVVTWMGGGYLTIAEIEAPPADDPLPPAENAHNVPQPA